MILFLDDWKRFPQARPDLTTRNRSFVRLASLYKEMGVKNHMFMLALFDQSLVGVDPFDYDNLTVQQKIAIGVECSQNPWYFFREIARAPGESGADAVYIEGNRGNIALFWTFFNHILIILIQIRQTGKSFNVDVLMTLLLNFICRDTKINLLTKDDDLRRKNIQRLKNIAEELPTYLQQKTREDANNGEELSIKSLGNYYNTHVPQMSEKRALLMGRGLTSSIFHVDEPPFQANIKISLPAALAATGAARDSARSAGAPYGTILTTTAGKIDDRDGEYVYNLMMNAAPWSERFLDCKNLEELELMVRANARGGKVHINATFDHRQLGKSDEWLRGKIEDALQEGDDANRDYFNMWTSGSKSNPLPKDVLEAIGKSAMGAVYTSIARVQGFLTRWYIPEATIAARLRSGRFIMGMDSSNGTGSDDITICLIDVEDLSVVAAGSYNELNLINFARWLADMLINMPNITLNPENKSSGTMIIDYLIIEFLKVGVDPFRRIFNSVVDDYLEFPDRYAEINMPMNRRDKSVYEKFRKYFGFTTAGSGKFSRSDLYSIVLQRAASQGKHVIRDKQLTGQILSLIDKGGRIDHPPGGHDDMVIAWLLANWTIMMAKNMQFYGIDSRLVMRLIVKEGKTKLDEYQVVEQRQLRERIDVLQEELSHEQDDAVAILIEREMRVLDRKLINENGEIHSVDELIRQANEQKRGQKSFNRGITSGGAYGRVLTNYGRPAGITPVGGTMSDRPLSLREMHEFRREN